jgi:S-adenosylmethionine synthetase
MPIQLAHRLTARLSQARERGEILWLRPDGKAQVTVRYVGGVPSSIETVVLSTQHTKDAVDPRTDTMSDKARAALIEKVIKPVILAESPKLWSNKITFHINPTGKFEIGGPAGDTGLTGRKIIVDTYGGLGRHGGGAFSGKDPSKVDRSASYMARHIAKNIVAAKLATCCEVQVAYAIGVADPVSVLVECKGAAGLDTRRLSAVVRDLFPLKPREIIAYLNLLRPIYRETAHDGHFGRTGKDFTWERTDRVADLRKAMGM